MMLSQEAAWCETPQPKRWLAEPKLSNLAISEHSLSSCQNLFTPRKKATVLGAPATVGRSGAKSENSRPDHWCKLHQVTYQQFGDYATKEGL
jgi:hypothetical protein